MGMLYEKLAIITGAGRGIGRAIAELYAREGALVVVNDIDRDVADQTAQAITMAGGKAVAIACDISKGTETDILFKNAVESFGRDSIDILVNNAGVTRDKVIHKMTDDDWDFVVNVNLKGTFNMIRSASPYMRDAGKRDKDAGREVHRYIVNFPSVAALMGNAGQANYSAAKGGIVSLTKSMAREWANFNINVNAIAPGFIATRMTDAIPDGPKQMLLMMVPFGRAGEPSEVANVALFLGSEMASYVTGQVISVNGGLYT